MNSCGTKRSALWADLKAFALGCLLFPMMAHAAQAPFSLQAHTQDRLVYLDWTIAPHHYLYKNQIKIDLKDPKNSSLGRIMFPKAGHTHDQLYGDQAVYRKQLKLVIPLQQTAAQSGLIKLLVRYQGCESGRICLPPETRLVSINLAKNRTLISDVGRKMETLKPSVAHLEHGNIALNLLTFFGMGILLAFSPCAFPLLPILAGMIIGKDATRSRALALASSYVMGIGISYASLGIAAAYFGASLQITLQTPAAHWLIALIMLFFACRLFDLIPSIFNFGWGTILHTWTNHLSRQGHILAMLCIGALSSLAISACVTPPLVAALTYSAQTGQIVLGASVLFVLGLGLGLPLWLIAVVGEKWLPRSGPWLRWTKILIGILMLGYAVTLVFPHITERFSQGQNAAQFEKIGTLDQLNTQLATAKTAHRPTLLQAYADWCATCRGLEQHVFTRPDIRTALKNWQALRLDLTQLSGQKQSIMATYHIIGPPTLIFFDANGQLKTRERLIGSFKPTQLLEILRHP